MKQVDMEASSSRTMENCCLVHLFEFLGNKNLIKKKKKNSVSVSKLNQNFIKNGEQYLLQVQIKGFMSKNLGESLVCCPV
jgi:hypothetical protein